MPASRKAADGSLRVALEGGDHLGEGPHWNSGTDQLVRVDINGGFVHVWDPATGIQVTQDVGAPVSFAIPRVRGGFVIGRQHSICATSENGSTESVLATLPDASDDLRFNDAKCDWRGRLWAGTMSTSRTPGAGALYCLEPDRELQVVIGGTTISNGLDWTPDAQTMYFIDSTTQRIDQFDFDLAAGTPVDRRIFAQIDPEDGLPDGLAVDTESGVWLCLFGGGALRRYSPEGQLDLEVRLPVSNPTSPAFGGPDLETIYVTTAKHRLSAEQLAAEELAGAVLALEPGVTGQIANPFAG